MTYSRVYILGLLAKSQLSPLLYRSDVEVSSFYGLVPPDDIPNSEFEVGAQPGNFGVVFGYQVDNLTHTW